MENAKIIDKIKKLLATANDKRGNPHEIALAAALAQLLINKHHINEAELYDREKSPLAAEFKRFIFAKIPDEIKYIIPILEDHQNIKCLYNLNFFSSARRQFVQCVEFYGTKTDLEISEYLLFFLYQQAAAGYKLESRRLGRLKKSSFLLGFMQAVNGKLSEAKRQTQAATTQQQREKFAIILADKSAAIERKIAEIHPQDTIKKQRSRRGSIDAASYYAGRERGQKTQLNNAIA
ncbi:MAG: DUF2786 domain-containing protein [Opitutales bacterium]|nr:DUF2786 domain-containing protein [Opitutales bacterium]